MAAKVETTGFRPQLPKGTFMPELTYDRFSVEVEHHDGTTILRLVGEFDLEAEPLFRRALDDASVGAGSFVELHLGDLTFIDSTGLRCLVLCARRVKRFVLVEPTAPVEKVLAVAGLGEVFDVRRAPMPGPPFRAHVERRGGTVVLRLVGELDAATLPRAHAAFDDAGIGPERTVELHLELLDHIDSSGLAAFIEVGRRARSLVLVDPSPVVDRALRVSGLESSFAIRRTSPRIEAEPVG